MRQEVNQTKEDAAQCISIYRNSFTFTESKVYLTSDIGEAHLYSGLMQELLSAQEGDIVEIWVNSGGGLLHTTLQIIEGIRACKGKVVGVIAGQCHSGASMIALSCDEVVVLESGHMMIHTSSGGYGGKNNEFRTYSEFAPQWIDNVLERIYEGFLDEDEIDMVAKGQDIWLNSDQIHQRLEKRNDYMRAKLEEEFNEESAGQPSCDSCKEKVFGCELESTDTWHVPDNGAILRDNNEDIC